MTSYIVYLYLPLTLTMLITFANNLEPNQDQQNVGPENQDQENVGPDLDPNHLTFR